MNLTAVELRVGDIISYELDTAEKRILACVVAVKATAGPRRTQEPLLYQLVNDLDPRIHYSAWVNNKQYDYSTDARFNLICDHAARAWWSFDGSCKKTKRYDNLFKDHNELKINNIKYKIKMWTDLFKWEYSINS